MKEERREDRYERESQNSADLVMSVYNVLST